MKTIVADRARAVEILKAVADDYAGEFDLEQMAFDLCQSISYDEARELIDQEEAEWDSLARMPHHGLQVLEIPTMGEGWEPYSIK